MRAMIFAAGLGTRLRPLTDLKPKALVEVAGKPMLEIVLLRLKKYGFNDVIINVHHFADQILSFLEENQNFEMNISISDEKDLLLDTGGGLKKARHFFADGRPFVVHNVDVLTDIDLGALYRFHCENNPLSTILVRHRRGSRFFLFDHKRQLCGWKNVKTDAQIIARRTSDPLEQIAFSCIHVIDPAIFNHMEESGVFSIIDVYLRLAKNHKILGFVDDESHWIDIGTPEKLEQADRLYRQINL